MKYPQPDNFATASTLAGWRSSGVAQCWWRWMVVFACETKNYLGCDGLSPLGS